MKAYQNLLDYYKSYFDLIDCFHFNSKIACDIYSTYITPKNGKVIPITHAGIKDHRIKKIFDTKVLHIGFIGNVTPYKGLPLLITALKNFNHTKWDLSVWGGNFGKEKNLPVYYKGKFNSTTITEVYNSMDVLVVPSIWKETFSLVTLEALSYGVPVIVSDNVGAQDIVKQYDERFVYHDIKGLQLLLGEIIENRSILENFNKKILELEWSHSIMKHAKSIVDEIYGNQSTEEALQRFP